MAECLPGLLFDSPFPKFFQVVESSFNLTVQLKPALLSKVLSGATYGVNAYLVEVETHLEKQLPSISIVGLPDSAESPSSA